MDKLELIRAVFCQAGLYQHAADDLLCQRLAEAMAPKPSVPFHKAEAAAREVLANEAPTAALDAVRFDSALRDLLAAIDAARGQAVAWVDEFGNAYPLSAYSGKGDWQDDHKRHWRRAYAAPPAALAVPAANVTPMRQPRADLARLVESINAAVYANGDGLSVTEAIGALELAKLELLKEQEQ